MPAVRAASKRFAGAAGPSASASSSSAASSASSSPMTPQDHLLTYVNNMRKCCDMSLFFNNLDQQGTNFIADSLLHANDIFAKYATVSRAVASPSKLAGELLKSPVRTRTRTKTAATRSRVAPATSDPFAHSEDISNKENAPLSTRSTRTRADKPKPSGASDKGKAKATDSDLDVNCHLPRRVLADVNAVVDNTTTTNKHATEPPKKRQAKASKMATQPPSSEEDSMALDLLHTSSDQQPVHAVPRASTPPPVIPSSPQKASHLNKAHQVRAEVAAIPIIDSDDEVDNSLDEAAPTSDQPDASAKDTTDHLESTSTFSSKLSHDDRTVTSDHSGVQDSVADNIKDSDHTATSSSIDLKLESARTALLVNKLKQQQKDAIAEKPAKRTLASYGAKKSLSATAHTSRPSSTTLIHPASTPAGPGFRSSFLNKSLRKQIADQQALDSDDDLDSDSDHDDADGRTCQTSIQPSKSRAAATEANTRANATVASKTPLTSQRKRKSDEAAEIVPASSPPPQKLSKLSTAMSSTRSATAGSSTAKKTPTAGPVSKLEQFRNNLAHITRSTGSGTSAVSHGSAGGSSSSRPAPNPTIDPADRPAEPPTHDASTDAEASTACAQAGSEQSNASSFSDSSAELTQKLKDAKSGESTIKASAIPRSPVRSPSRAAADAPSSPVRLPPRTGSVRKSPRKLTEQVEKDEAQTILRPGSPGKTRAATTGTNPFQTESAAPSVRAPTSPSPQPRSLAALFGSPKPASKLPTLANAAGGSTTPANSPPKHLQTGRIPFPTASFETSSRLQEQHRQQQQQQQQQSQQQKHKTLPHIPIEKGGSSVQNGGIQPSERVPSASSRLDGASVEERESQFFDARSRENSPETDEAPSARVTQSVSKPSDKKSMPASAPSSSSGQTKIDAAKAPVLSPKKVTSKAAGKAQPASPSKTGSLRGTSASPSKARNQASKTSTAPSTSGAAPSSPSRTWGLGEKIKGFLGLHTSTTTHSATVAAQTKVSASSNFQPRPRTASISQSSTIASTSISSTATAAMPESKHIVVPGALLTSPTASSKTAATVNSTPSSIATVGGKPASLARAELLRKKQAEDEERKAKEKEERRQVLLAKKEERAKAAAQEEQEKENKKRARDNQAPAAIPAALLNGIHVGPAGVSAASTNNANTSRTSTISSASSGGPPTRPSSALNGTYAGVKSRYMQNVTAVNTLGGAAAQNPQQDSNKKRRITADKEAAAPGTGTAHIGPPRPAPSSNAQLNAPKMVRSISQSSMRPPQPHPQPQQTVSSQHTKLVKPTVASSTVAAPAFAPVQRIPGLGPSNAAAMMGNKVNLAAPPKPMPNTGFSSANPFQQAKQQQLHQQQMQLQLQMQKQKQMQMQQQQQAAASNAAAAAAALREQELHRAAQLQFQMQNAAGGRFEEHEQQDGNANDEPLPDIVSEYSDSEDEETIQKRAAMPSWTKGDALDAALLAQSTVDADEIFGIPQGPVELEKILPSERVLNRIRRPRSSSANWSGQDGLAQWEIDRYNKRMGIKSSGVFLHRDGAQQPPPPPAAMRMSIVNRPSTAFHPHHPNNATNGGGGADGSSSSTPGASSSNNGRKEERKI